MASPHTLKKGPGLLRTSSARRMLTAVTLAAGLTVLAGCGGGDDPAPEGDDVTSGAASEEDEPTLVIWEGSSTPINANFNPFSPASLHGTIGPIFEPLFAYNRMGEPARIPMLATEAEFTEDGTGMTVKIRPGVRWNDGEEFTADDVVFSFEFDLARPDYLTAVEKVDDETVRLTFDGPHFTQEAQILQTLIIPEHVWSDLGETATDTDDEGGLAFLNADDPVGTGPFLVERVNRSDYTMVANTDYWQEGRPHLGRLQYLTTDDDEAAEELLRRGELDWAGVFIPGAEELTADGPLSMINTPEDLTAIYTCSNADLGCEGPQTDPAVRRALHLVIDRDAINDKAFAGHAGHANPAFTLPGRDDDWVADGIPARNLESGDVDAAREILEEAGYELNGDDTYEKDGAALQMTLASVEGWTDHNDVAAMVEEQAAQAGIRLETVTIPWDEFTTDRDTGQFHLIIGGIFGTPSSDPHQVYAAWFGGQATMPVGESLRAGTWNFSRYSNPDVDAAIKDAARTADVDEKKAAYATVQEHIAHDLPYIPLLTNPTMTFYNSTDFTGWPTEDDLYMFPPSWGAISSGVILSNIQAIEE